MKYVVFGDTGGHYDLLEESLKEIGVDFKNFTIPKNTKIIHVGDLIHKFNGTNKIVKLVSKLIETDNWIQLVGNHEMMHLGLGTFYSCNCNNETIQILQSLWNNKKLYVATSVKNIKTQFWSSGKRPIEQKNIENILFTHSGLTNLFWKNYLNETKDLDFLVNLLNNLKVQNIVKPGLMINQTISFNAGPVWAESSNEVYSSWEKSNNEMPFNQIFGHSTPYIYDLKRWFPNTPISFIKNTKINTEKRFLITKFKESFLFSIDPGLTERKSTLKKQPYITFKT